MGMTLWGQQFRIACPPSPFVLSPRHRLFSATLSVELRSRTAVQHGCPSGKLSLFTFASIGKISQLGLTEFGSKTWPNLTQLNATCPG